MDAGIRLERNRLRRKAITKATVNALDVNVLSCEAIAALVIQRLHGELAKRREARRVVVPRAGTPPGAGANRIGVA